MLQQSCFKLLYDLHRPGNIPFCLEDVRQGNQTEAICHDILPGLIGLKAISDMLLGLFQAIPLV